LEKNRKDVRLPVNMQRAMATEAEATREARAKVISAEGEQKASIALKGAADVINQSPVALQLRYLQTLTNISAEKNSTIIFPVPIEMLSHFSSNNRSNSSSSSSGSGIIQIKKILIIFQILACYCFIFILSLNFIFKI